MTTESNSIIITSINPNSNLDHQLLCFNRWKEIGFEIVTVNVKDEANLLIEAGLDESCIRVIENENCGSRIFGKPLPLIKSVLNIVYNDFSRYYYILTNSDIFPAIRSNSIVKYWHSVNEGIAFTREECISIESHSFIDESAYRGGLDFFFMTRDFLLKMINNISTLDSSNRMAFGIPGWDFLLGASIISSYMNGTIMDSGVLLHVTHQPTYTHVDEFKNYLPDLHKFINLLSDNPAKAADEFAATIINECNKNASMSRMAILLYFTPISLNYYVANEDIAFYDISEHLFNLAPQLKNYYKNKSLRLLFERLAKEKDSYFGIALNFLLNSRSKLFQFTQTLFSIALVLNYKIMLLNWHYSESYPIENQHKAALKNILNRHDESDPLRRLFVAKLFGNELIDHRIFNRRLFNYLALNCSYDTDRALINEIIKLVRSKNNVTQSH